MYSEKKLVYTYQYYKDGNCMRVTINSSLSGSIESKFCKMIIQVSSLIMDLFL